MKFEFSRWSFIKCSSVKFHENPDRQTDTHVTHLVVAFGNFANAPKKENCVTGEIRPWNPCLQAYHILCIWRRVACYEYADVSEEPAAPIFRFIPLKWRHVLIFIVSVVRTSNLASLYRWMASPVCKMNDKECLFYLNELTYRAHDTISLMSNYVF